MRHIHPVGFQEKFVASGVYTNFDGDDSASTTEQWSIHELPDAAQLLRVDCDRMIDSLIIEAWRSPVAAGGRIERLDMALLATRVQRKAVCILDANRVQISYGVDGEPRQYREVSVPPDCLLSAGSTLLLGFMLAEIAKNNGDCSPVCICYYSNASFDAEIHEFSAVKRDQGAVSIAGESIDAWRYQWLHPCNPVPDHVHLDAQQQPAFWLDRYNVLLRTHNKAGDILLTQYARRPEPTRT